MWKEETPVSRLIDELVGKKSLYKYAFIYDTSRGVYVPFIFYYMEVDFYQ